MKLTTPVHPVPRLRMVCLHGVDRESVTFTFTSEHKVQGSTELPTMTNSRD